MSNEVFYLCLSTMKTYTAAEAVGMRTLNGKKVRKPAFKPTKLDAYWKPHAEFVLEELYHHVALAGDDTRDEHAETHGISSDALAESAQYLIASISKSTAFQEGNLQHACRIKDTYVEPETVAWVSYVAEDLTQAGFDDIDDDDVRVLRHIVRLLKR
jgi:hypothetical protein